MHLPPISLDNSVKRRNILFVCFLWWIYVLAHFVLSWSFEEILALGPKASPLHCRGRPVADFMDAHQTRKPLNIHLVSSLDSPVFTHLSRTLACSSLVALDAEWKPVRNHDRQSPPSFPAVTLLQLACQSGPQLGVSSDELTQSSVFLLDLLSIPLSSIWDLLRKLFASPDVLKLGFRFKQDLVYLSTTFSSHGCDPGFDRIDPFMDITNLYNLLQQKQHGRKTHKEVKSLATICGEILSLPLSKELQCSDWSHRPLTEEQILYAAMDAHCLLEIFNVFHSQVVQEEGFLKKVPELNPLDVDLGLKVVLEKQNSSDRVLRIKISEALDVIRATTLHCPQNIIMADGSFLKSSLMSTVPMDECLLKIVKKYGEKIVLKESDKNPRSSKRKVKRSKEVVRKENRIENVDDWLGLPPWDVSLGGDGCPKFLCDVMVEGLAKHLRCVGIDAAIPYSKKPDTRKLIDQACKEKRVLLTRDAKLLRHGYLIRNQIYRVKSLLKNEQLIEVIDTFQLNISEDQLMSRCTKCNGRFIQKPLTTEEAVRAAMGFQRIPNCLFNKNLEFWQCTDCRQLYWEGTQYHNAVQKFIDVCKLKE